MKSKELVTSGLGIAGVTMGLMIWPVAPTTARTTEVDVSQPDSPVRVVRHRTPGKAQASFQAQPASIEHGAYVRFDIHAEASDRVTPRWSCVATQDVAECFKGPVEVRYMQDDERMVLTVTAGYLSALLSPDPDADPAVASR